MRILHLIPTLGKGGAERYCADVCLELSRREGVEVMLVAMNPVNTYGFITNDLNYKVCNSRVFPSISKKSTIDITEYAQLVDSFQPDIVHSHLFWAELLSREVYREGTRYVTHCQNNMPEFRNFGWKDIFRKSAWTQWYEKNWIIKRYRRCRNNFLVISKDTETYYKKVLPPDLQRITLMYHAIQFDRFHTAYINRLASLPKITIVYTARFAVYKNHTFLVDIVEELKARGRDVELYFLGNGELMEATRERVKQKNLQAEVHFEGVVDNVEEYLKKANIYVHPAYYEPFGLVLIEAMAAGLPVVCLDGKGNRDLIEQGQNGYMFYEQDANVFADQIIQLVDSPELYEKISDNAVHYARKFDIKQHVDGLLEYYKRL